MSSGPAADIAHRLLRRSATVDTLFTLQYEKDFEPGEMSVREGIGGPGSVQENICYVRVRDKLSTQHFLLYGKVVACDLGSEGTGPPSISLGCPGPADVYSDVARAFFGQVAALFEISDNELSFWQTPAHIVPEVTLWCDGPNIFETGPVFQEHTITVLCPPRMTALFRPSLASRLAGATLGPFGMDKKGNAPGVHPMSRLLGKIVLVSAFMGSSTMTTGSGVDRKYAIIATHVEMY